MDIIFGKVKAIVADKNYTDQHLQEKRGAGKRNYELIRTTELVDTVLCLFGNEKLNTEPLPSLLSTHILPLCLRTKS